MRAIAAWQRFWFTPAAPEPLALARIGFFAMLLVMYGTQDLGFVSALAELRWRPISFFASLFPAGPPAPEITAAVLWIWRGALFAALLGIATRVACAIAAPLGLYLIGLPYCVSRMSHEMAAPAMVLIVLAFARSGDALSSDARRQRREASPEYQWPIQVVRVVISLVFFSAGLSKLRHAGLDWIATDNLQLLIGQREQPLGLWLAEWPLLCRGLAAATIGIEVLHPLALFSRRAALVLVPGGLLMLLGSWLTVGVPFWPLIVIHLFWLPGKKGCGDAGIRTLDTSFASILV